MGRYCALALLVLNLENLRWSGQIHVHPFSQVQKRSARQSAAKVKLDIYIYKVIYSRKSQKQKLEPLKTAKAAQDYKART